MRAISQNILQPLITKISTKITYIKFISCLPGDNELIGILMQMNFIWIYSFENTICYLADMLLAYISIEHIHSDQIIAIHI